MWHRMSSVRAGECRFGLFDIDRLAHCMRLGVQNKDLTIRGHHRDPTGAKGHGLSCDARGQGDFGGQVWPIRRQADDKQGNYHYKPANHHHRQCGHQSAQEFQLRWLVLNFRLGRISHGQPPDRVYHRGRPA